MTMKPTLGRIVHYRSRTGTYTLAPIVTATQDTLFRPGVEAGNIPDLSSDEHVHLGVFTSGEEDAEGSAQRAVDAQRIVDAQERLAHGVTIHEDVALAQRELVRAQEAMRARSTPAGGTYQEFDIAHDESGETPGTWRWPPRV